MKTFKQFVEQVAAPKKKKEPKGPSKTPATDSMKTKHTRERDALADRGKADKAKQSIEFQQMTSTQKGEMEKAKKSDKSAGKRKAVADKRKKQQAQQAKRK